MGAGVERTLTADVAPAEPAPADGNGGGPAPGDRTSRDRRALGLALGATLLPLVATAIALVAAGDSYRPAGDLAMTELHVRDVGRHEVLVGLWSRWDWSHPGPVLFYLLAPLYRLSGSASIGLNLGALVINGAAITGMLLVARRRGGTPLMLCTALGCLLLLRTLGGEFAGDPWNLYITVFPFALLFFLAWSMACGDLWTVPAAVGVASFLVQTHVGFLVLVTPVVAWGLAALAWPALRRGGDPALRARLLRSGGVAGGVLVVLWLPPFLDSLLHSPANLTRIFDYFQDPDDSTNPVSHGWRVISGQFALTPEWLTWKRAPNPTTGEPLVISSPRIPVLLLPVIAAGVWLWRRGSGEGRRLVVTLAVVLVTGVVAIVRTIGPVFDYRLRWTWAPPMLAFVVVTWVAWRAVAGRQRDLERRWLVPIAAAACLVLGAVNVASGARSGIPHEPDSDVVAALTPPVVDALDRDGGQVVVSEFDNSIAGPWYSRSLVLQLERRGFDTRVPADMRPYFSRRLVEDDDAPVQHRLIVATDDQVDRADRVPGYRALARWSAVPEPERARIAGELAELAEDRDAGRLGGLEYWDRARPLQEELAGEGGTTANVVVVYVDEGWSPPWARSALG